jgi:Mlc titration factor MtfA (ptsG expression regulator)
MAWRRRQIIARCHIGPAIWKAAIRDLPVLNRLTHDEKDDLTQLAIQFLHDKEIVAAGDLVIDNTVCVTIALQACLPILYLGLDWYVGWHSVIVYPSGFTRKQNHTDESGLTHSSQVALSGEAWLRGPVVLSWDSVRLTGQLDGYNVVIHEFVHKLDMLNGRANGFPPMHPDMSPHEWTRVFHDAFEDFKIKPRHGIDRYGPTVTLDPHQFMCRAN